MSLKELKLFGIKLHDYHAVMQQLLLVALCLILPKHVRYTILCIFFYELRTKVVDVPKLNEVYNELVVTLCLFEKYFPPSFFDIILHVIMHLIRKVRLCGPICFRWMYPFERYMKVLKRYVYYHNQLEICITECYIVNKVIEFCIE